MKYALAIVLVAASAVAATALWGPRALGEHPAAGVTRAPAVQDKASLWMKHKLGASQKILEGLTRGDFASIEEQANGMQVMGYLEGWVRAEMPEYKAQLHAFQHANGAMIREAQQKNLDGVTIAYTQLTISCVQCHKLVRGAAK